jgi:hypothetical protein
VARSAGRLAAVPVPGRGNLKVTYTGGYQTIPTDLELAVHQVAARARTMRATGAPMESESYEGYSYNLGDAVKSALLVGETVAILSRYKRLAI